MGHKCGAIDKRLGVTSPTFRKWAEELHVQPFQGKGRALLYREEDIERMYREKVMPRPIEEKP